MNPLNIDIFVPTAAILRNATRVFYALSFVSVFVSRVGDLTGSTIVCPGNALGEMKHGYGGMMNVLLSNHSSGHLVQDDVQREIHRTWGGELPVGESVYVPTNGMLPCRHLIYTHTGLLPYTPPNHHTHLNILKSFESSCRRAIQSGITHITTPIFGLEEGINIEHASKQMKQAILNIYDPEVIHNNLRVFPKHTIQKVPRRGTMESDVLGYNAFDEIHYDSWEE